MTGMTVGKALGVAGELARLHRLERGEGSLDDAADADWTLEARLQAALVETGLPSLPLRSRGRLAERRRTNARRAGAPLDRGAGRAVAR